MFHSTDEIVANWLYNAIFGSVRSFFTSIAIYIGLYFVTSLLLHTIACKKDPLQKQKQGGYFVPILRYKRILDVYEISPLLLLGMCFNLIVVPLSLYTLFGGSAYGRLTEAALLSRLELVLAFVLIAPVSVAIFWGKIASRFGLSPVLWGILSFFLNLFVYPSFITPLYFAFSKLLPIGAAGDPGAAPSALNASSQTAAVTGLTCTSGPCKGRRILAPSRGTQAKACIIGRDAGCGIVINSPEISRRHVKVEFEPDRIRVTDLNSKNGVFALRNALKIRINGSEELLRGESFEIGMPPSRFTVI